MNAKLTLCLSALLLPVAAPMASAAPIGALGLQSLGAGDLTLTSFNLTADPSALPLPGPPWNSDVSSATTLMFAGGPLTIQEGVTVNAGMPIGSAPPAGAGIYNPFLTFETHANLQYFLTSIDPGSSNTNCVGLAVGQSCSFVVAGTPSPFVWTWDGTNTHFSIGLGGFVTDGTGSSAWSGGFSAVIPGLTPQEIQMFFCGAGPCSAASAAGSPTLFVQAVTGTFSTPETPVPEPGSLSLCLLGLGAATARLRRMRVR